jgi:hypothetical protein
LQSESGTIRVVDPWLARLRHDLLKPVLWRARDLDASGQRPGHDDLAAFRRALLEVADENGKPTTACSWWRERRRQAPATLPGSALDAFEMALAAAEDAMSEQDAPAALAAIRRLEAAFASLVEPTR